MIPEKYRILMNNEIDGLNSPSEREELESYLERNPDARLYFEELMSSLGILDDLEEVEMPADLHGRIMRAVQKKTAADRGTWREFLFGRLRLGYVASVSAGVLVGLLIHVLIPVGGLGGSSIALDLFRGTATTELEGGWTALDPVELNRGTASVRAHPYRLDDLVLVRLDIESGGEVRAGIGFKAGVSMRALHFATNTGFAAVTSGGSVTLEGSGSCRCEFLFDGVDAPGLVVELDTGPEGVLRQEITWF